MKNYTIKTYTFMFDKELKQHFPKDVNRVKYFLTQLINKSEHLQLIFNEIKETEHVNIDLFNQKEVVYIYTPDYVFIEGVRDILGRKNNKYKEYINKLIELELIEYQVDKYGHRILNKYDKEINSFLLKPKLLTGYKKIKEIDDKPILKTINTLYKNRYNNLNPIIKDTYNRIKGYDFDLIRLTKRTFKRIMTNKYSTYVLKNKSKQKSYVSLEAYLDNHIKTTYNYIIRWNKSTEEERLDFFNTELDKFGHRFHYLLTNIPSELRKYLIKDMISIDIKNSQPFIAACLMFKETGTKDIDFIRSIEKGSFYENMYENSEYLQSLTSNKKDGRNLAKTVWCRNAYGHNTEELITSFPEGGSIIANWKKENIKELNPNELHYYNRTKNAVLLLQRTESSIMNKIWNECIKKGLFFYPLHDATYVSKNDYKKCRKIVMNVLDKLNVKYYLNID